MAKKKIPVKKWLKYGAWLFVLLFVIALAQSRSKGNGKNNGKSAVKLFPVVTGKVVRGTAVERISLNGEIKGLNQADIYPDVPGKIKQIFVREGQYVYKNQLVATVDRSQVGMVFMPAAVRSPISGVIGKIYVDQGVTVSQSVPLMMVADTRIVEGVLNIPEKYMKSFRIGQRADIRVESYPDQVFSGYVYKIASFVDPSTRTLEVKLRLVNRGGKLVPGNYADFTVITRQIPNQVLVPADAVMDSIVRQEVFLVKTGDHALTEKKTGDERKAQGSAVSNTNRSSAAGRPGETNTRAQTAAAQLQRVELGIRDGDMIQVLSGLQPGQVVVTMGKENIRNGAFLKIVQPSTNK